MDQHKQRYIINCASVEYFKSLENSDLKAKIITPIFKEIRLGKPKIISFLAKKARGMMARYIVQNQINKKDQILNFNLDGYKYNPELSSSEYGQSLLEKTNTFLSTYNHPYYNLLNPINLLKRKSKFKYCYYRSCRSW